MTGSNAAHALLIFGLAFVLEDVAVLGAALLVVNSMVSLPWAAGSSFAGIWFGDLGLYFLAIRYGRPVLEKPWFKKLFRKVDFGRSEGWFQHHGTLAILLSRTIPGTRLPTYLAAGLLKVPASRFLSVTAAACLVWVGILFWFSYHVGMMMISGFQMFRSEAAKLAACAFIAVIVGWTLRKLLKKIPLHSQAAAIGKITRWEFWPMPVFYIPVLLKYLALAIRYRSFGLPTLANPGMHTGGLIGESKYETLAALLKSHPGLVAETHLVPFHSSEQQLAAIEKLRAEKEAEFPLVFKPDVGQRGDGFKLVHSQAEADLYVKRFSRDLLVQEYAPGPFEAGIFYYRFPEEKTGKILAITEKLFPSVSGDGQLTLDELIRRDPRASILANVYLQRFAAERSRVLAAGETLRLVEAGNHCQGAIFLDGWRLYSAELEAAIDRISRSVPGFFVGRYDLRYSSEDALRNGAGFQIVELNGASSEATNIYDPSNSLWNAYRTLFRQWEIIFQIAAQNRKRGLNATPLATLWKNWARYREEAAAYPASD